MMTRRRDFCILVFLRLCRCIKHLLTYLFT